MKKAKFHGRSFVSYFSLYNFSNEGVQGAEDKVGITPFELVDTVKKQMGR